MGAPLIGAMCWILAVAATVAGLGDLTLIDALMLLAVLVIVPAAIPLHPAGGLRAATAATVVGLPVAPALLGGRGTGAAVLIVPWVVAAGAGALVAAWWWRAPTWSGHTAWPTRSASRCSR